MWYLPEPNKKDLDLFVGDMKSKIKGQAYYTNYKDFFEKDEAGKKHDYIQDLLEGKPSNLYRMNEELMRRIIGKEYNDDDMKALTEVNKKITSSMKSGKKAKLNIEEKRIFNNYSRKVGELKKIFNYNWISNNKTYAYWLSNVKHINTCPYCNRQYTMTLQRKKNGEVIDYIARPHFDHWFPQESFPLLALSFYNLVPSCPDCNSSLKGNHVMKLEDYVHPYEQKEGYEPQFKFRVLLKGDTEFELFETRSPDQKEENMMRDFCIRDIYKYHEQLEVGDLVKLRRAHSNTYLTKFMASILKDLGSNYNLRDIIKMVFGTEIESTHLNDRPLSKLKKDLLVQFRIIDEQGNIHPELQQQMKKS